MITCCDCNEVFSLDANDLAFYDDMSPIIKNEKLKVCLPNKCSKCRERRRLAWRNDRSLYRRACNLCNKSIISCYKPEYPAPVYCNSCWHSDNWNMDKYYLDYDPNQKFFDQYKKLLDSVHHLSLLNVNPYNSEYGNHTVDLKNCYLVFASGWNEDVMYASRTWNNKNCIDIVESGYNELCYSIVGCHKSYNLKYSAYCNSCTNSSFLYDCSNSSDCFGSANLRNSQYVFFNKQLTKENYEKIISKIDLGSYKIVNEIEAKFKEHLKSQPKRATHMTNCEDCHGDMLTNSKNSFSCFNIDKAEDCKYCELGVAPKRSYDCSGVSYGELCLGIVNHVTSSRTISGVITYYNNDCYYIYNCQSCTNLLGCTGLHRKNYRILNKQYSKDEYEKLFTHIIKELIKENMFGDFFPSYISPFNFSETEAASILPLDNKILKELGYNISEQKILVNDTETEKLPDNILDVDISYIGKSITGRSGQKFIITKSEFDFYKQNSIPLPRDHSDERYLKLISNRNPRIIFDTHCTECSADIKTNYPIEKRNLILCNECYNKKLY